MSDNNYPEKIVMIFNLLLEAQFMSVLINDMGMLEKCKKFETIICNTKEDYEYWPIIEKVSRELVSYLDQDRAKYLYLLDIALRESSAGFQRNNFEILHAEISLYLQKYRHGF